MMPNDLAPDVVALFDQRWAAAHHSLRDLIRTYVECHADYRKAGYSPQLAIAAFAAALGDAWDPDSLVSALAAAVSILADE